MEISKFLSIRVNQSSLNKLRYEFIHFAYRNKITHVPSCLSSLMYIPFVLQSFKEANLSKNDIYFVDGKRFVKGLYDFLSINNFVSYVYYDTNLFNSLGVGLGLSYMNPDKLIWINVSDSQLTNGLFYEFYYQLQKFQIRNILVTVDYNKKRLRDDCDLSFVKSLSYIHFINSMSNQVCTLTLPTIVLFETIKGYNFKLFMEDPYKYHYKPIDDSIFQELMNEV